MSDYIEIEEFESNFAQVPKAALKDKRLSLKSKGLYAYLFSLPKGWKVYKSELLNHLSDGKDSLNSAFKELEGTGYLLSTPIREAGKFKGYKLKLLIKTDNEDLPERKNRNGKTGNGESASINTDNSNTDLSNSVLSEDNTQCGLFPDEPKQPEAKIEKKEEGAREKSFDERAGLFVEAFNKVVNRKYKATTKVKQALKQRLKSYTAADILKAVNAASKHQFHVDNNFQYLTPAYILREDILERYLNAPVATAKQSTATEIVLQ